MEKYLTVSDVTGKFSVPAGWLRILPEFGEGHKVVVRAIDGKGVHWAFLCTIRRTGPYKKPEFQSREWLIFVDHKRLTVGDKIVIWKEEDLFMGPRYRIRAQKWIGEGLWVDVDV